MKRWLWVFALFCFNAVNLSAQESLPQSNVPTKIIEQSTPVDSANHTQDIENIATELEKTGALVEKVPTDNINPTVDSIASDGISNLIQYNPDNIKSKSDPYPLSSYQGDLLPDIESIKQAFNKDHITQVKASLETLYQKDKITFPLEGYLMLATLYDQLQIYDQADNMLKEGMLIANQDQKAIFELNEAQVLRHFGKNKESIEILNHLDQNIIQTHPEIFFNLGLSYLYLNTDDLAILNFRKYLDALPRGEQTIKVRRAIAWLILNKSGKISDKSTGANPQDLEKMLQLLVDKQLTDQVGDLIKSTSTDVDSKALDIQSKELEDLTQYSNIED